MAQVNMSLRIDAELKDAFMAAAKSMDRNGSQLIRDFMRQTVERIGYSASSLAGQPYKGRNGRVEGTRELVIHPHFVLVYEVDSQWGKVYILRVLHTAQKWP